MGGDECPAGPVEGAARDVQSDARVAEVYGPERGHLAAGQVHHRDVVGVDVLEHRHLTALGVESQVHVAADAQQAASVLQVAVVNHVAAGLLVGSQLAGLAVVVREVSDEVVTERADVGVVDGIHARQAAHVALRDHFVLLQVIDQEGDSHPVLVFGHETPVTAVGRRAAFVLRPHGSQRLAGEVGREVMHQALLVNTPVVSHQAGLLDVVD